MDRLLARLERTFGKLAVEQLSVVIVGAMGICFLLTYAVPGLPALLALDLDLVARGQVWRLFTYLFLPPSSSPLWILFQLYWTWLIASNLEAHWGSFKFNVFYFLGMVGTTIAAIVTREPQTNLWLNLSMFLAFATLFPDYEIYLFLMVPLRVKWIALVSVVGIALEFAQGDWGLRAAVIAAMANYGLFFGGHLAGLVGQRNVGVRQAARRSAYRASEPPKSTGRTCAICGATEADGADIRVCSCAKCGGPRTLCLEHARNH